uniref:hypothetical protein n=1 Tax=Alistipes putredinis TaxID=28117 RepID=UPI003FD87DB7
GCKGTKNNVKIVLRGLFFIYRRQDLFIYIGIFSVPLPPGCLPTGAVGAGAFGRKEGGACRLSGVSGVSRVLRGLREKFFFRKGTKQRDSFDRNPVK